MSRVFLHKFFKSIRYGAIAMIVVFILDLYSNPLDFHFLNDLLVFPIGVCIGFLSEFIIGRRFRRLYYPLQIFIEIIAITLITTLLFFFAAFLYSRFVELDYSTVLNYIQSDVYIVILARSIIVSIIVITFFQVERLLGRKTLSKFLFGSYDRPKEQERIFMFIDMKDATTHAEAMGNTKFFQMVNRTFEDMTYPALKHNAEILKYIGDEVVFTWPMKAGLRKNNCVDLFFSIQKAMEKNKNYYLKRYGFVPTYKAGIHGGKIICAQVGDLKKSIDYSGDVINTTARLESICNENDARLIISKDLFDQLPLSSIYETKDLPGLSLKGKDQVIDVIKITARQDRKRRITQVI